MSTTGNKGEWSEFYTFIKILSDKYLHAADEDLNIIEQVFYPVLKVIRKEAETGKQEYIIDNNTDKIEIIDEQIMLTQKGVKAFYQAKVKEFRQRSTNINLGRGSVFKGLFFLIVIILIILVIIFAPQINSWLIS